MDVLNIMNVCPVQLRCNGWWQVLAFGQKCEVEGVEPTAALFFYFYRAECQNKGYASVIRRTNRPKIMLGCPKNWADKFFLIRPLPGVHPWWIGEDGRPLFRTN